MRDKSYAAIVIGASAGAVETLSKIFYALPEDYSLPILVVVHIPPDKQSLMPELFRLKCKVNVKEAADKEILKKGTIYFAPPNYHLLAEPDGSLSLSSEEEVLYSRPSIDVLFETAADAYGEKLIGVILTGANEDGARGLKAVMDNGGTGLVLDPSQAFAPAMPTAALKFSPAAQCLSLDQITDFLLKAS